MARPAAIDGDRASASAEAPSGGVEPGAVAADGAKPGHHAARQRSELARSNADAERIGGARLGELDPPSGPLADPGAACGPEDDRGLAPVQRGAAGGAAEPAPESLHPEPTTAGGLASLAPVPRPTVQESVYLELRRSLIAGAIDAGQLLRIRDLAARLSVSTMPVREALARLVSEGALDAMAHRTVRVPPITRARLDDLEASRRLIEGGLLARAMPRLGPGELAELRRLTAAYDDLAPPAVDATAATADLNHAFHFAIYRAAGSGILLPIVESLWTQSGPVIRRAAALFERRPSPRATEHHHEIIAAIEAGDEAAAQRALAADIGRAFALVRETLGDGNG